MKNEKVKMKKSFVPNRSKAITIKVRLMSHFKKKTFWRGQQWSQNFELRLLILKKKIPNQNTMHSISFLPRFEEMNFGLA